MSNDQNDDKKGLSVVVRQTTTHGDNSSMNSPSKINQKSNLDDIKGAAWNECVEKNEEMKEVINTLDSKLNLVLAKQEYEYLKGYNIYVKRKERELRELIGKLNDKNSNNTLKDEKIQNLEKTIQSIQQDQIKMQKDKDDQTKLIKKW